MDSRWCVMSAMGRGSECCPRRDVNEDVRLRARQGIALVRDECRGARQ